MEAFEAAISATSTEFAPWHVIPADHKHVMQAMVASIVVDTIEAFDLKWPTVSDKASADNARAREVLENEPDE